MLDLIYKGIVMILLGGILITQIMILKNSPPPIGALIKAEDKRAVFEKFPVVIVHHVMQDVNISH